MVSIIFTLNNVLLHSEWCGYVPSMCFSCERPGNKSRVSSIDSPTPWILNSPSSVSLHVRLSLSLSVSPTHTRSHAAEKRYIRMKFYLALDEIHLAPKISVNFLKNYMYKKIKKCKPLICELPPEATRKSHIYSERWDLQLSNVPIFSRNTLWLF